MTLGSFFEGNLAPCIGIIILLIFLRENLMLDRTVKRIFYQLIILELMELIAYNTELWTATLPQPTALRMLLSAIGYALRPLLVYMIIRLNTRKSSRSAGDYLLLVPAGINVLVAFSVFFSDLAYSYDAHNVFHRGPLGFVPQIVTVFYILVLLCKALLDMQKQKEKRLESTVLLIVMVYLAGTMIVEAVFLVRSIGRTAIVMSTIFYYMFFQTQKFRDSMDQEYRIRMSAEQRAKRDTATGLLNKVAFREEITKALAKPVDKGTALLFIDIDHFKLVNDELGHLSGDEILQQIAGLLRGAFGPKDILGRFGGDEFCVLVQEISYQQLSNKLEQLLGKVRNYYPSERYPIKITLSIGAAYIKEKTVPNPLTILELADQAAYTAKGNGRDRWEIIFVK